MVTFYKEYIKKIDISNSSYTYVTSTNNRDVRFFYYSDYDFIFDPRPKHIREAERKYGKLDEAFV